MAGGGVAVCWINYLSLSFGTSHAVDRLGPLTTQSSKYIKNCESEWKRFSLALLLHTSFLTPCPNHHKALCISSPTFPFPGTPGSSSRETNISSSFHRYQTLPNPQTESHLPLFLPSNYFLFQLSSLSFLPPPLLISPPCDCLYLLCVLPCLTSAALLCLQVKGNSDRPGPEFCPRFEASFTEILVPSESEYEVVIRAVNLQVSTAILSYNNEEDIKRTCRRSMVSSRCSGAGAPGAQGC